MSAPTSIPMQRGRGSMNRAASVFDVVHEAYRTVSSAGISTPSIQHRFTFDAVIPSKILPLPILMVSHAHSSRGKAACFGGSRSRLSNPLMTASMHQLQRTRDPWARSLATGVRLRHPTLDFTTPSTRFVRKSLLQLKRGTSRSVAKRSGWCMHEWLKSRSSFD